MSAEPIRTFSDEERSLYGGDYAITRTMPRIHPTLGIKIKGTRDSITGADIQYRSFFRGDIIFRDAPEKEFNFALWNKDNSSTAAIEASRKHWMRLRSGGFTPCQFSDWDIAPDLQQVYTEKDGLLVLTGGADGLLMGGVTSYDVVMYRTKERLLIEEAKLNVAPTPASINAKAQESIGAVLTDKRISAMPTQIEEIAHRYVPASDADTE